MKLDIVQLIVVLMGLVVGSEPFAQMGAPPTSGPPAAQPVSPNPARPVAPPQIQMPSQPAPASPVHPAAPQISIPITASPPSEPAASMEQRAVAPTARPAPNHAQRRCEALSSARARQECRRSAAAQEQRPATGR